MRGLRGLFAEAMAAFGGKRDGGFRLPAEKSRHQALFRFASASR